MLRKSEICLLFVLTCITIFTFNIAVVFSFHTVFAAFLVSIVLINIFPRRREIIFSLCALVTFYLLIPLFDLLLIYTLCCVFVLGVIRLTSLFHRLSLMGLIILVFELVSNYVQVDSAFLFYSILIFRGILLCVEDSKIPFSSRFNYILNPLNISFLLFPIIPLKKEEYASIGKLNFISAESVRCFCIGVFQILIYRVLIKYFSFSPDQITSIPKALVFCIFTYLAYIRVSGYFHIVTSLVSMSGYQLGATHKGQFFSKNMSEFWHSTNIYWTQFITKVVYNPLVKFVVNLGLKAQIVILTVISFTFSMLFHLYQEFLLVNEFNYNSAEYVFWSITCVFVIFSNLKRLSSSSKKESFLKSLAFFLFMSVLWTYWSGVDFSLLLKDSDKIVEQDFLMLLCVVMIYYGAYFFSKKINFNKRHVQYFFILLLVGLNLFPFSYIQKLKIQAITLKDINKLTMNYYDKLLQPQKVNILKDFDNRRVRFEDGTHMDSYDIYDQVDGGRKFILKRSFQSILLQKNFSTDEYGLRKQKRLNTDQSRNKIAIVGSSISFGLGVSDEETFSTIIQNDSKGDIDTYNLSIPSYNIYQKRLHLQNLSKVHDFDHIFVMIHLDFPSAYVLLKRQMSELGYDDKDNLDTLELVFKENIEKIESTFTGKVSYILIPSLKRIYSEDILKHKEKLLTFFKSSGLDYENISNVYAGHKPSKLMIFPWDAHPNRKGHKLLAKKILPIIKKRLK